MQCRCVETFQPNSNRPQKRAMTRNLVRFPKKLVRVASLAAFAAIILSASTALYLIGGFADFSAVNSAFAQGQGQGQRAARAVVKGKARAVVKVAGVVRDKARVRAVVKAARQAHRT